MGDLRYAVRALLQNRLTTAAAVVSLALGIGANVALFAVFNAIVFKPLPARDPGRLANVYASYPDGARYGTSSNHRSIALCQGLSRSDQCVRHGESIPDDSSHRSLEGCGGPVPLVSEIA